METNYYLSFVFNCYDNNFIFNKKKIKKKESRIKELDYL